MEQTDHICEKCSKEFSCVDEPNDDYSNWCGNCYKQMIQDKCADEEYDR